MKGDNLKEIIKSPAFTILVGTICVLVIMNQVPVIVKNIQEIRKGN